MSLDVLAFVYCLIACLYYNVLYNDYSKAFDKNKFMPVAGSCK
jgi:hypothetical protein